MVKALIRDNKAYCPKCKQCNYQLTNDYKLIEYKGKKYDEFVVRCLTDDCNEKFYFQSEITMESTIRHSFSKEDEIEIKED
jgi:hypothetical protein